MRKAIIDLGTNTFNLLIADTKPNGSFKNVFKDKIMVKLGQGGLDQNIISTQSYQRGLEAIQKHLQSIQKYKVNEYRAIATSAIRSTKNGPQFVKDVYENLNLEIEVIDGDTEAELIYYGVKQIVPFDNSYNLIMDIGGGSTEFIIANNQGIKWAKSYQLGVSRLKEIFKPSDLISKKEITQLNQYFELELSSLVLQLKQTPCKNLIGSSGSFDTIVEMIANQFNDLERIKHKYCFIKNNEYNWLQKVLINSTLQERLKMDGMLEMRADMIVLSIVLINFLLKHSTIEQISRSKYALKEGAINKYI